MSGACRPVGCLPPPGVPPEGALWGSVMTAGAVVRPGLVRQAGQVSSTRRPRRRTLGMRARVTVLFSLAGLLLAAALALLTFSLARNQLASQRDDVALQQAFVNASLVRDLLRTQRVSPNEVISQVRPDNGGFALYHFNSDDRWFQQSIRFSSADLPARSAEDVLDGDTGRQRFVLRRPALPRSRRQRGRVRHPVLRGLPAGAAGPQPAGGRRLAGPRQRGRRPSWPPPSAGRPAVGCCARCREWRTQPASWPRAGWTPDSNPSGTRTSTGS